jgi:hypothetical protein
MAPPDPWEETKRVPGDQPLPKLDEFGKWVREKFKTVVAPLMAEAFYGFDKTTLDTLKSQYVPNTLAGEMGCMKACYQVLKILYGEKVSKTLQKDLYIQSMKQAERVAPKDQVKAKIDALKAANPKLTDQDARRTALESWASNYNSSDHLYKLMAEREMAGTGVNAQNTAAEQTIRDMSANAPGVYYYGLAVKDNHTVTLAVDRAADGSQKMYWLDQNQPGLSHEVKTGDLGGELQKVQGYTDSTNIYPLRPPAGGNPKD